MMKNNQLPTLQEIEKLTAFLPRLYSDGFVPVQSWGGGEQKDGSISLPYPNYHPVVEEFFRLVSGDGFDKLSYIASVMRDESRPFMDGSRGSGT